MSTSNEQKVLNDQTAKAFSFAESVGTRQYINAFYQRLFSQGKLQPKNNKTDHYDLQQPVDFKGNDLFFLSKK